MTGCWCFPGAKPCAAPSAVILVRRVGSTDRRPLPWRRSDRAQAPPLLDLHQGREAPWPHQVVALSLPPPSPRGRRSGHRHVPAVLGTRGGGRGPAEADRGGGCAWQQEAGDGVAGSHAQGMGPWWSAQGQAGDGLLLRGPASPGQDCPSQLQPGQGPSQCCSCLPCRPPSSSTNLGTSNRTGRRRGGKATRDWRNRRVRLPGAIRTPFINAPQLPAYGLRFLLMPRWVEAQLHYR